ncbi:MAG: D-alanyl-D-alanine carboxypeptidase/D-alanyl-D-alanine-endopeptidase [Bacteroidales bacterium]|nr:D-alanyl-D-alanine carboxypeptidase/D-alanyl-D-alanine-endopeptidase [Bacteroidales bacterium]
MRKHISLISVALLLLGWSATAGIPRTAAQQAVAKIRSQEPLRHALVGVLAVRADGDTLAAINIREKLVPASNVKLLTTGLALHTLGADYRFETRIAYSGSIDEEGKLTGDLYILGGGDPTTGSRADCAIPLDQTLAAWMKLVQDAGIRCIEGRVLGDPRCFGSVTSQNLGWTYDDLGANYGAGPQGLNFFENAQNFYVTPGPSVGATPYVRPRYPDTPWMQYAVHATTGAARSTNGLYYVNTAFGPYGEVAGSFPIDRKGYTLECSNLFGAYTCAYYFYTYLQTRGIVVKGGFGDVTPQGQVRTDLAFSSVRPRAEKPASLTVLGGTQSPRLSDIVRETNCDSNNFYAETLLKTVALKTGFSADFEDAEAAASAAMRGLGLRTDDVCRQFDGSGLSRKNYVSPEFFVRFLRKMTTLPVWDAYFESLPVPGKKGTLEQMFPGSTQAFRDRIHMKSGSMNGVRCYSGYILSTDGNPQHTIVFSLMINNCTAGTWMVNPAIYGIIEALAAEN